MHKKYIIRRQPTFKQTNDKNSTVYTGIRDDI